MLKSKKAEAGEMLITIMKFILAAITFLILMLFVLKARGIFFPGPDINELALDAIMYESQTGIEIMNEANLDTFIAYFPMSLGEGYSIINSPNGNKLCLYYTDPYGWIDEPAVYWRDIILTTYTDMDTIDIFEQISCKEYPDKYTITLVGGYNELTGSIDEGTEKMPGAPVLASPTPALLNYKLYITRSDSEYEIQIVSPFAPTYSTVGK